MMVKDLDYLVKTAIKSFWDTKQDNWPPVAIPPIEERLFVVDSWTHLQTCSRLSPLSKVYQWNAYIPVKHTCRDISVPPKTGIS